MIKKQNPGEEVSMTTATNHRSTVLITLGGTLTGFYKAVQAEDVLRTVLLAATGTVVSFLLTLLLKWVFKKRMK